jgi:hypothetical protein
MTKKIDELNQSKNSVDEKIVNLEKMKQSLTKLFAINKKKQDENRRNNSK